MNERLIELANKANEDVGYTFKLEDAKQIHELLGKFAELIVRECANQLDDGADDGMWARSVLYTHFGVEE